MARILIVEDNHANLELIRFILEAFGHSPSSAMSGQEGVEAARRDLPDLILMDLQMPGMDGFAALDELRRDAAFASIPVVALTAYALVGDRERALRAGFDGYITKPIAPETFVPVIDDFLPERLRSTKRTALPGSREEEPSHGS